MVPDTWHVSVTCRHVSVTCRHVSITNSASRWATEVCQGSNWGRISPGIQWRWSQTHDTCPSRVDMCPSLTLLLDELQRCARGQNGVEFCQENYYKLYYKRYLKLYGQTMHWSMMIEAELWSKAGDFATFADIQQKGGHTEDRGKLRHLWWHPTEGRPH